MRPILWLFAALLLSACATQTPPLSEANQARLAPILERWNLRARVVIYQERRADHLQLLWRHEAHRNEIDVLDPLGRLQARIFENASSASMQTADGKDFRADSAAALLRQLSGFEWPLQALPNWIQARPAADGPLTLESGADGLPEWLHQQGWSLHYLEWQAAEDNSSAVRPAQIYLRNGTLSFKINIDDWFVSLENASEDQLFEGLDAAP